MTATIDWALIEKNVGEACRDGHLDDPECRWFNETLHEILNRRDDRVFICLNDLLRTTGLDLLNYDHEAATSGEDLTK